MKIKVKRKTDYISYYRGYRKGVEIGKLKAERTRLAQKEAWEEAYQALQESYDSLDRAYYKVRDENVRLRWKLTAKFHERMRYYIAGMVTVVVSYALGKR